MMKTVHIIIKAEFYIFIKVVVVGNPRKMINDRRNESHAHTYYIYTCAYFRLVANAKNTTTTV